MIFKKVNFFVLKIFVFVFVALSIVANVSGAPITDLRNQIDSLQSQLDQLNSQKKSLQDATNNAKKEQQNTNSVIIDLNNKIQESQNDIAILEIEIQKSETEIQLTKEKILQAEKDIEALDKEIIDLQKEQKNRINNLYQNYTVKSASEENNVSLPTQIDEYISKTNYQKQLKAKGDQIFVTLAHKKELREKEHEEKESQKIEQEKLHFALTDQKKSLEDLKVAMATDIEKRQQYAKVLGQSIIDNSTKSSQIDSQTAELKAKVSKLQQELFTAMNGIPASGVKVNKGDLIGYMGDTGYSTGPHLHFFVSKNGSSLLDPCNYLPKGVSSACNYGNGELRWPMDEVYWSRGFSYPDPGHGAIDIYAFKNIEVYASHSGYLIRGKEKCYSWFPICKDGGANYVIICESQDCKSGFKTGYWHLK